MRAEREPLRRYAWEREFQESYPQSTTDVYQKLQVQSSSGISLLNFLNVCVCGGGEYTKKSCFLSATDWEFVEFLLVGTNLENCLPNATSLSDRWAVSTQISPSREIFHQVKQPVHKPVRGFKNSPDVSFHPQPADLRTDIANKDQYEFKCGFFLTKSNR